MLRRKSRLCRTQKSNQNQKTDRERVRGEAQGHSKRDMTLYVKIILNKTVHNILELSSFISHLPRQMGTFDIYSLTI